MAALLEAGAWTFLVSADRLNSTTPHLEVPFFLSLGAVLLATTAIGVELVRTARRLRESRAARGLRIVFHLLALAAVLSGSLAALTAFMAAIFPTC